MAVVGVGGTTSRDLWMAPMDSLEKLREFAAGPYREAAPRLSPDGRFVVYESGRTGTDEIYIRPVSGTGLGDEVRVSPAGGIDPVWSRSGNEVFFVAGDKLHREISGSPTSQMMAAQVTTSPKLAVTGVRALFSMREYMSLLGRPSYDVFANGDFLLLATQSDSTVLRTPPLVVRINWASGFGERQPGSR